MFGFSPPGKGFAMRKGEADVGSGQQTGDQHVQRLRWGGLVSGVEGGGPEGSGCRWKVEPKEGRGARGEGPGEAVGPGPEGPMVWGRKL